MKKLGLLFLAGALTIGLAACGGADEETTAPKQEESTEAGAASGVEEYTITATNWDFTSDKELTIKKGTKVKINLVNKEGMHTISSEGLGIEMGADKPAEFTADKTGEYELICSTVCGATEDHEAMKISLKIVD
ncbi:heme/copper-type cytochrome/quinol oxidase subunit 2 [Neobacillus niacini]|uniref:cupredoxin domain-containing protein n=1 Tax=Neobacillus niacini TaxID=86668 RepID=UPI00285ABD7F|nr:cupredoxin domain-containing protein [Neobacillus niacini]MDR7077452.1 heme/copper-type cytochrome/quinol oxidase subunit 2 [Neobacillus niacini]